MKPAAMEPVETVITGMGILSCAGGNLAAAREKFIAGQCCLTPITHPRAARLRARFAGQISQPHSSPELPGHDRHVHLALVAAREALAHAAVQPEHFGRRLGLIFSTCSGPMLLIEAHYERMLQGQPQLSAAGLFARRYYAGAQILAHTLGIRGLCTTVVTACSASTAAIALAADLIRCGRLEAALAGGADAFSISTLAGFDGLKATSEGKCAPFSKPPGLNLGEAAAFVFLESAASAHQRGATPWATVLGSGMSNDAHHCSAPEPGGRGLTAAIHAALADAHLSPEQISYINAHGTGTEANDKAEHKALRKVFGERTATLPVSSTKSIVGHCLGAAGATEAIAAIVCATAGVLPPTANFAGPRDGCVMDCVPDAGRTWPAPKIFLSNNSAFGGHNASLALAVGRNPQANPPVKTTRSEPVEPIVITGCGIVSPAGIGVAALARARDDVAQASKPACRGLANAGSTVSTRVDSLPGLPSLPAGRVDESAVESFDRRLNLRSMDPSSKWATLACRLAIREARFPEKPAALAELGLFLNLSAGPSWAESEFLTSFLSNDHQVAQLSAFPYIVPSSVAGNVCRALMLTGHNLTLNPGPAAGLHGLEPALAALRCGHAAALLCGAVDELSDRILADHFYAGEISADQPPGEGAAILMLETAAHARARAVQPIAEIHGLASLTRAHPTMDDVNEVISAALTEAALPREALHALLYYGNPAQLPPACREISRPAALAMGRLEGAQPLVDLAGLLCATDLPANGWILSLAVTQHLTCAAVFKKC